MITNQDLIQNAANSFMLISVSLSKWSGVAQVKDGSAQAAVQAGANPEAYRGYINLLGAHHSELKKVNGAFNKLRTYIYENTLPFSQQEFDKQQRGQRLIAISRVPEVLANLQSLKDEAQTLLTDFLAEYERLVYIARSQDMGSWAIELDHPSADEVSDKFGITISPPQPVPVIDLERLGSIPVSLAQEIAEANARALTGQLEKAKKEAIRNAESQLGRVIKQLEDGSRIHDSLLSDTVRSGQMLRDISEGFDHDRPIEVIADIITDEVANVASADGWRNDGWKKLTAKQAAANALNSLRNEKNKQKTIAQAVADQNDGTFVGGVLADLVE